MEPKQSFSTSEVAKYCHVTADTIRKWAEAGRIRVFKTPGGHRRIRHQDLIDFLRENEIPIHPDLSAPRLRVLLVEPEQSVLSSLRRCLDRMAAQLDVETAADLFEAGRQLTSFRPDVVFLASQVPGADGLSLCRRVKEFPEHAATRIILTGTNDELPAETGQQQYGVAAALSKPFSPDDVRRVLAKIGVEVA